MLEHKAVAFVSGRSIADLDRLLAPHRFALAGVHGGERRDGSGRMTASATSTAGLDGVRAALHRFGSEHDGIVVEDKGIKLALHYRQRPDLLQAVERLRREVVASLPDEYELLPGNRVFELKPAGVDKGRAIRAFMSEPPFAGRVPVFIGDDVTDEAGFRAVNELGGQSIKVGGGATEAKASLPDIDAVFAWLESRIDEQGRMPAGDGNE